jgi:hypothetical protein
VRFDRRTHPAILKAEERTAMKSESCRPDGQCPVYGKTRGRWLGPVMAGSDKPQNGRYPSARCCEGLHTCHAGSRCPVCSRDRSESRVTASRRTFYQADPPRTSRGPDRGLFKSSKRTERFRLPERPDNLEQPGYRLAAGPPWLSVPRHWPPGIVKTATPDDRGPAAPQASLHLDSGPNDRLDRLLARPKLLG